jgi:GntR family transcriptional regulator
MRLAAEILADIRAQGLEPGARLRSERELASGYGVAYQTLRKAMKVLAERGIVESVHGQGTYVRKVPPE